MTQADFYEGIFKQQSELQVKAATERIEKLLEVIDAALNAVEIIK